MTSFITQYDRERLIFVLTHELQRKFGRYVIDPALGGRFDTIDLDRAIEIETLPDETRREIEPWPFARLAPHVPLADISRLVTGLAHERCVRDAFDREVGMVVDHAIDVSIATGQECSAARSAKGCDDKSVSESKTFAG